MTRLWVLFICLVLLMLTVSSWPSASTSGPNIEVKVDGKVIAAFDVKEKPIDPKDLLTRLAKAARVAVVLNPPGLNRKLDPYYLGALKDDIVVLKGPEETFRLRPGPVPPK